MKLFGCFVTVVIIIVAAPVICWMMESGDRKLRTIGILLVFSLAGIFYVAQKLTERPPSA